MIGSNEAGFSYLKYRRNQRKQNGTLLSITRDNLVTITLSQEPLLAGCNLINRLKL
jgi:hypothetical protein